MQEENLDSFWLPVVQSSLLNELYRYDRISCYYFGKSIFLLLIFGAESRRRRRLKGFERVLKMSDLFLMSRATVRKEELHSLAFEETTVSFLEYSVLEEIIDAELVPVSADDRRTPEK